MDILTRDAENKPTRFRMRKPTDFHQHLRDGSMLKLVAPMVAKRFRTAIIMPNLKPPITTATQVEDYMTRIRETTGRSFCPMMTLYLTDTLEPSTVWDALSSKLAIGIKYYPPGLTTNSEEGVEDPSALWTKGTKPYKCLRELADYSGVFLIHAADGVASGRWDNEDRYYNPGDELDPYDQEAHFIRNTLPRICEAHPELKISVEHLSTVIGANWMRTLGGEKLGCSLTAQHLLLDRRDSFKSGKRMGFNPHRFWWPVIQSNEHRQELRKLAMEDHPFVWLGSDSAPHLRTSKETDCCSGGVLMAHAGIELYAEAFDDMNALDDRFERFASINGRRFYDVDGFYGLHPSDETIELVREEWTVREMFYATDDKDDYAATNAAQVVPFRLGETIRWKLV